jgi:hypothetical protein
MTTVMISFAAGLGRGRSRLSLRCSDAARRLNDAMPSDDEATGGLTDRTRARDRDPNSPETLGPGHS